VTEINVFGAHASPWTTPCITHCGIAVDRRRQQPLRGVVGAGIGRQIRRLLEVCRNRGWLRDDVPFDEVVETAAVIASIDTYTRVVQRDGWSVDAYRAWFERMLHEVVFRPDPASPPETGA
jgi:hypothetical protein